jgi:hypothetical protein
MSILHLYGNFVESLAINSYSDNSLNGEEALLVNEALSCFLILTKFPRNYSCNIGTLFTFPNLQVFPTSFQSLLYHLCL